MSTSEYRNLPAVDALLRTDEIMLLTAEFGVEQVTTAARTLLAAARQAIASGQAAPGPDAWPALLLAHLQAAETSSLRPVINATGVIIHTNLGRAPLCRAALDAAQAVAQGYSSLEYDLVAGERGSRHDHARHLLCELTGAEDALVVNNNAAAVYLVLAGLCQDQAVLISRGQLVEIGGGFRIPDVLRQSGARLVEVGTTNRTHRRDFTAAAFPGVAAIMRVHSSNFRQIGFVTMPTLAELATDAHDCGLLLIDDLGSGTLLNTTAFGLDPEPMVQESVAAGADIVTFSGDKLLGGPQAGIVLGRNELIETLRNHPMARALRVDKLTLAALEATLRVYRRGRAIQELPVWQMIGASAAELQTRAERWRARLADQGISASLWPGESTVGGGSLPGATLPTWLLALPVSQPDRLASRLRAQPWPVVCRIQQEHLVCDPRTVLPEQEDALLTALAAALKM